MNDRRIFLKCVILLSISICSSIGDHSEYIHENQNQQQQQNEVIHDDIVAKLNKSDPVALAAAIEKEPKFFDEFECK